MMNRRQCLAAMAAPCFVPAQQVAAWKGDANGSFSARGEEILHTVRANFFDADKAKAWADRHAGLGSRAADEEDFKRIIGDAIRDLKASHTAYYTTTDARYYGLAAIFSHILRDVPAEWDSPGIDATQDGFVRRVFAGGPGEQSGLKRGDKILQADGGPFRLVESCRHRHGRSVTLEVQRTPNSLPMNAVLIPRRINAKREWLEDQEKGTRIVERHGRRIVYAPMFSGAGQEHFDSLKSAVVGPLAGGDALVIDFRDGFGGCNPDFVNLFDRNVPTLEQTLRGGKTLRYDPSWRKPVVLLVNEGSASGKEIVAHTMKKRRLATLVGQRTAGSVLGGRCFPLLNRTLLYLAVADVTVDGKRLEGVGIEPDILIDESLPFANGADPQLEKALEVAAKLAKEDAHAGP
jgi:carboxyl-terminal processing protease